MLDLSPNNHDWHTQKRLDKYICFEWIVKERYAALDIENSFPANVVFTHLLGFIFNTDSWCVAQNIQGKDASDE